MIEIKDFLGKEFKKGTRVVYIKNSSLVRGYVAGINKEKQIKVEDELTKKSEIISNLKNVYAYPEFIDLSEELGFKKVDNEDIVVNKRAFERELSDIVDIAGDKVLPGDKVILNYNGDLKIGRLTEINKEKNKLYVEVNSEKYPVEILNPKEIMYLLVPDYYVKLK